MRHAALAGLALTVSSLLAAGSANALPWHHHHRVVVIEQQQPVAMPNVTPNVTIVQPQVQSPLQSQLQQDPMGNPAVFSENVQRRLDRLSFQMSRAREDGFAEQQAANEFEANRQTVQNLLSQASNDGYVAPGERQEIHRLLDRMQVAVDDAREERNRAIGGGPQYYQQQPMQQQTPVAPDYQINIR